MYTHKYFLSILLLCVCCTQKPSKDNATKQLIFSDKSFERKDSSDTQDEYLGFCVFDYCMPLSDSQVDTLTKRQGIYVDIAELLARQFQKKASFYFEKDLFFSRPLRRGLVAGKCTIQMGLARPKKGKYLVPNKMLASDVFLQVGYVLVAPKGKKMNDIRVLAHKKVAFISGSPPQQTIAKIGASYEPVANEEEAMKKLSEGNVDFAFIWGPKAGWLNKYVYQSSFDIYTTPYVWEVVLGVSAKEEHGLLPLVNAQIRAIQSQINNLQSLYGIAFTKHLRIPKQYQ